MKPDRFGLKTLLHAIMGVVILLAANLISSLPFDLLYGIMRVEPSFLQGIARTVMQPLMAIAITFLLTYLYITRILKMSLRDFRVCRPGNIAVWILCALALPLCVSGFFVFLTPGIFAAGNLVPGLVVIRVLYAVLGVCLSAGMIEELIFRGFIMHLLEIRWNRHIAIIAPSVLFGVLHIFNMESFNAVDVLMLLAAGTSVGIMFSMITYQSGSIWPAAIVHGLWNLVIIGGILDISLEPGRSLFTYTLQSRSTLLTGGAFGIESSVPAIAGYLVIIVIAWLLGRQETSKRKNV